MGSGSGRAAVLFVDADAAGRLPLEVGLLAAGFDVVVGGSEADALAILDRTAVDLVIANGDTLLSFTHALGRRLKAESGRHPVSLIVLGDDPALVERVAHLELAVDELLLRPVWSGELVARVRLLLQKQLQAELASPEAPVRPVIEGLLAQVSVFDLLQSVESNRRSGTIRITALDGRSGKICFRDGRAVDAELEDLRGREAVHQLVSFHDGHFAVQWGHVAEPDMLATHPRVLGLEGVRKMVGPGTDEQVAVAREPGVERRGTVLSGTIQNNRGTGSTAIGWAPALPIPADPGVSSTFSLRSRNVRVALAGAVVGAVVVVLLFVPSRHYLPASQGNAPAAPRSTAQIAVTPLPAMPVPLGRAEALDSGRSPVKACRDVASLGKAARTVELCNRAFLALPDSAPIAAILAQAELDQGHYELAGEWAQKAVDLDPALAEPYAFLGFVADQAGRRREAHAAYRRYLELAPSGSYAEDINAILSGK